MDIRLVTQPAPTIPPSVQEALDELSPRVFMQWNARWKWKDLPYGHWEARWEIWCEVGDTSHPDAKNERAETDVWNHEAGCWMRRLQTYKNADGSFAPLDERLLVGLEMADAWKPSNRRLYDESVVEAHTQQELARERERKEMFADASEYYNDYDRTLVGSHVSGDWRWRTR